MKSQKIKIFVVIAAVVAVAAAVPHTGSFIILLVTRALAFSILVMSLDILLGFTGLASMGQAAYLGVSAYLAPEPERVAQREPLGRAPLRPPVGSPQGQMG